MPARWVVSNPHLCVTNARISRQATLLGMNPWKFAPKSALLVCSIGAKADKIVISNLTRIVPAWQHTLLHDKWIVHQGVTNLRLPVVAESTTNYRGSDKVTSHNNRNRKRPSSSEKANERMGAPKLLFRERSKTSTQDLVHLGEIGNRPWLHLLLRGCQQVLQRAEHAMQPQSSE